MRPRTVSGATKGLGSELYSVLLRHNESNEIVGMGRIVGDGGTVFHICDMAVEEEWQGKGGGSMIMDSLMEYITREASGYSYINLMADVDGFYERWGFKPTSPNSRGMYLRLSDSYYQNVPEWPVLPTTRVTYFRYFANLVLTITRHALQRTRSSYRMRFC